MTQERKDQLFTKMLGVIAEHLSEDGNTPEALERFLGMSREEMQECGVIGKDIKPRSIAEQFEHKIQYCLACHKAAWEGLTPKSLIEQAESIASFQFMARRSVQIASENEKAYLLRFKDPLKVLADCWNNRQGMDFGEDDSVSAILWELTDRRGAEGDYELEPEYYDSDQTLSM